MSDPSRPPESHPDPAAPPDPGMALKRQQHLLIFLTVLIDLIGFGILIPVIQPIAEELGAPIWIATVLMGVYSLMQFIFSPVLGRLSDRVGRVPVLVMSLWASVGGYLVMSLAVSGWVAPMTGIILLFAARIITGIGGASISTAQSYLSDITAPEKRAGVMGMIGAAFGLGFMIGPVIGGILSHFGGRAAPFLFAAGLSVLNVLLMARRLPETLPPEKRGATRTSPSVFAVALANRGTALPAILLANFLVIGAFSTMTAAFVLFLKNHASFQFNEMQIGYCFGFIGIVGVIIQGGIIRRIAKNNNEGRLALTGLVLMVIAMIWLPFTTPWLILVLNMWLMAAGNSLTNPCLNTLASRCGTLQNQGLTMGAMTGAGSLGRFFGALLAGPLLMLNQQDALHYGRAAFLTAALVMAVAALPLLAARKAPSLA
jgi:MFS family permease